MSALLVLLLQDHEFSDGKQLLEDTTAHERLLSELLKDMKELVRDGNRMVTLKVIPLTTCYGI